MDMTPDFFSYIQKDWTLFLDRDGVINHETETDYIRNPDEFRFLDGVLPAFPLLNGSFSRIFVVTNQKGIGKGLMSEDDLADIHQKMGNSVRDSGGHIDRIYYCSALDDEAPCRKPNTGMASAAKKDFPEIEFSRSLMVGNTMADMQFGKSLGMYTVFILSQKPVPAIPDPLIDAVFPNLFALAKALQKSGMQNKFS